MVVSRIKVGTTTVSLKRKRFYLFRGGFDVNRKLVDRLKTAIALSRDCYYCQAHASAEFMGWLKDCETPHCREITADDIAKVPEFQAAYQKGTASSTFSKKPELAQTWLVTNLEEPFRVGFYGERQKEIKELLNGLAAPIQSSMTNASGISATFLNIPLQPAGSASTEKFLLSNLVPIEVRESKKSFVWACEVELGGTKKTQTLEASDVSKLVKKCEVIVRELPDCTAGTCTQK